MKELQLVRTKVPLESREEVVRDQRLVILLTKRERERYERAVLRHRYRGISDMVREAAERLLDELEKKDLHDAGQQGEQQG